MGEEGCRQGGLAKNRQAQILSFFRCEMIYQKSCSVGGDQNLLTSAQLGCRLWSLLSRASETSLAPGICHGALMAPFILTPTASTHVLDYFNTFLTHLS